MSLPDFWWMKGAQAKAIRDELNALGNRIEEHGRIEFHPEGAPGLQQIRVVVRDTGGVTALDGGGTNNSFRCPPICP